MTSERCHSDGMAVSHNYQTPMSFRHITFERIDKIHKIYAET